MGTLLSRDPGYFSLSDETERTSIFLSFYELIEDLIESKH